MSGYYICGECYQDLTHHMDHCSRKSENTPPAFVPASSSFPTNYKEIRAERLHIAAIVMGGMLSNATTKLLLQNGDVIVHQLLPSRALVYADALIKRIDEEGEK